MARTKRLDVSEVQARVLLQSLQAVAWDALPKGHEEQKAAQVVTRQVKDILEDFAREQGGPVR